MKFKSIKIHIDLTVIGTANKWTEDKLLLHRQGPITLDAMQEIIDQIRQAFMLNRKIVKRPKLI